MIYEKQDPASIWDREAVAHSWSRVYHLPLTEEEARTELQRCAGSQFDPRVVAAFLQVLEEQEQQRNLQVAKL